MLPPSTADQVARLAEAEVLCVGDVMLDRFVYGVVERISPEAPIPVMAVREERAMLGGAGNVLRNLSALGASCAFFSVVGDDAPGEEIRGLLDHSPRLSDHVRRHADRRTSVKTRYLAGGQQLLRADAETIAPLAGDQAAALIADARARIQAQRPGVLVLSDYGKGVLADPVAPALIALGRKAGLPVIVDPKGRDFGRYRGASLITPNRKELMEATGLPCADDAGVVEACRQVIATCGIDAVLATRSQDGMTLVVGEAGVAGRAPPGAVHHLPAQAREVFDVSGAGDTVVATLAAALGVGVPLAEACHLANTAAGIAVGRIGTAAVPAADLMAALRHEDLEVSESKVVTLEQAQDRVGKWRRQGLTVGFTNGCFDLLHPGHISLLRQARAACDRLIVGLNSDASVARLKGPERPVQAEMARATVLASLAGVDLVVIFSEDTPLALIRALLPDVLVKGADYTVDTVVGADIVQAAGGRVLLARLEDGFSTTATIARLDGSSRTQAPE